MKERRGELTYTLETTSLHPTIHILMGLDRIGSTSANCKSHHLTASTERGTGTSEEKPGAARSNNATAERIVHFMTVDLLFMRMGGRMIRGNQPQPCRLLTVKVVINNY